MGYFKPLIQWLVGAQEFTTGGNDKNREQGTGILYLAYMGNVSFMSSYIPFLS